MSGVNSVYFQEKNAPDLATLLGSKYVALKILILNLLEAREKKKINNCFHREKGEKRGGEEKRSDLSFFECKFLLLWIPNCLSWKIFNSGGHDVTDNWWKKTKVVGAVCAEKVDQGRPIRGGVASFFWREEWKAE